MSTSPCLVSHLGVSVISSMATSKNGLRQLIDLLEPAVVTPPKVKESQLLAEHLAHIEKIKKSGKEDDLIEEEIIEARYDFINKDLSGAIVKMKVLFLGMKS